MRVCCAPPAPPCSLALQAGQDRFRSVTRSYYRGAVACMVVFSLADRASYDKLPQWLADARAQARSDISLILVGNKADLGDARQGGLRALARARAHTRAQMHSRCHRSCRASVCAAPSCAVTVLEASRLAQREGCAYVETSARTGDGVEAAFFKLARGVLTKVADGQLDAAALGGRAGAAAAAGRANVGKDAAAAATESGCSC